MFDLDAFSCWAAAQDLPADEVAALRTDAQQLVTLARSGPVLPKHVDQLLEQRQSANPNAAEIERLRKTGAAIHAFQREQSAVIVPIAPSTPQRACLSLVPPPPPQVQSRRGSTRAVAGLFFAVFGGAGLYRGMHGQPAYVAPPPSALRPAPTMTALRPIQPPPPMVVQLAQKLPEVRLPPHSGGSAPTAIKPRSRTAASKPPAPVLYTVTDED
jgi:hypothetical protein